MNTTFHKLLSLVLLTVLSLVTALNAADTTGIKEANLKGADVALMNDHDPASELENFDMLPGYQANLFATDPMLANPIHMHWDSRGRLWVACSWSYPQLKPGAVADDKIIILEDTDNDGAADKSTVFADGLYLPTGLELANGGCYVGQSPDIYFLKDTDGDDIADVKELALTGFGIEDSHHSISAWRRGPGGWIYFQEGIFLHAQVETQYGVVRNFNGGVYQFNPRTRELRIFCRGTGGNPWGHVFDRWGQSFMVNNPRIVYLSPASGNSGESVPVKSLISTEKQCGGDLATGSHVGDDIRGQLLTGRFKSRAVVRYEFIEDGAGFSARVLEPLISSRHPNFRPVDVKTGPDGAIYVADWYNSIINHAQHDFRDPRRDHEHGRIWRITHKERPLVEKPELVGISIQALADHLKSPEDWTRHQARKELSEHDPNKVQKVLEAWVDTLDAELPDHDHHLVEAMWACQNVERVSEKILTLVLNASDGNARSAGARVLRYWHQDLSDPIAMVAKAADDPFPRTRMEAVLSAGFIPKAEAYPAALHSLDHPGDPALDQALPQTAKALEQYWRPAMEAGTLTFAKDSHRQFVEQNAGIGFDRRLAEFLKNPSPGRQAIGDLASQLVAVGSGTEIRLLVKSLTGDKNPPSPAVSIALLESMKQMAGSKQSKGINRAVGGLRKLLDHDNKTIASLAAENLGAWNAPKAGATLLNLVESKTQTAAVRHSAATALARLGKTEYVEALKELTTDDDIATRYAATKGLIQADLERGVLAAVAVFTEDPGDSDPIPILQAILKDRKGSRTLTEKLDKLTIHPSIAERVAAFHRETGQLPETIAALFQPQPGDNASLSAILLAEDQDALTADVVKLGDPRRGEMIYRRKALACSNCHAIGSAGPQIGPNLVAVGAAATPDYMVESILSPNAAIAEHYENRLFTLKDGSIQMGVITFKSESEVVVRDSAQAGKEIRMAAAEIQKEQAMPSLMPAGLADQLKSRQEFLDLAKFLSVLGRPGEFANDESPVIRKWRVIAAPTNEDPLPDDNAAWFPAYSKVNGELPAKELILGNPMLAQGYANVQVGGTIKLAINETTGLKLWIDGKPVDDLSAPFELEKGRHKLTFKIDPEHRHDIGLRVELEAADDKVKVQPEGGL
jgi:putative heme-binding domain-containing protein